jgi:hypothetical protein
VSLVKWTKSHFKATKTEVTKLKRNIKKYMKIRNIAAIAATIATVATIQSAQAAFSDTLADLIANHGTLTIDDKTFSGFNATLSGAPLTSFDTASIIVNASMAGGVDYLTWNGNIAIASSSTVVGDLKLNYIVTANPGSINMIDQSYTGSASAGSFLAIDETVATGAFGGPIVASSHLNGVVLSQTDPTVGPNLIVNPAQSVLWVTKDISLATVGAGLVTISQVSQSFHQVVPEPTTVIAGALLLLPFGVSTLRIMRKNRIS